MTKRLEGEVAVVTGGTSGIGKAIAEKFAAEGASVVIFGTNPLKGKEAAESIQKQDPEAQVVFIAVDVSDHQAVAQAIQEVISTFGSIDILVNNAGITRDKLMLRMTEEDWDQVMRVNAKSCYNCAHASLPVMLKARKGKIINVSSIVGLSGNMGQANYAASKAAMIGFTKALAKETARRNICVNCIAPGYIQTPMTESLSEEQRSHLLQMTPLGRFGDPEDVAEAALFLASKQSSFITGQVLAVDGGLVMGG